MPPVRPVSRLFTSARIAEAITLGEHLFGCYRLDVASKKMGDCRSRPFLLAPFQYRQANAPPVVRGVTPLGCAAAPKPAPTTCQTQPGPPVGASLLAMAL